MTSDRVYRWRLLLEKYDPEIIYIKGVDNTVADAISRLRYDPAKDANVKNLHFKECYCNMATLLSHFHVGIKTRENYKILRDTSSGRPHKNLGGKTDYTKICHDCHWRQRTNLPANCQGDSKQAEITLDI